MKERIPKREKLRGDRYYEKVTALAMAAVVAASALTGCGSSSTAETTAAATETKTEAKTEAAAADSTEAAKEGRQDLQRRYLPVSPASSS